MKWMFAGISERNLRPTNMDSLLAAERRINGTEVLLAAVCDGVGSQADGAFASAFATESLESWFCAQTSTEGMAPALRERILRINHEIVLQAQRQRLATASTLTALLLLDGRYTALCAGDSRIYALDRTGVQQLTCDDVTEDGKLTEYLGRAGAVRVQYLEGEAAQRGFLLCTDGFYRRMPQELLPQAAGARRRAELDRLLTEMSRTVKQRGERDNISAVIIKTKG